MRLLLVAVLAGQAAGPFAGTWTAAFKGDTYVRLELRDVNGTLSGRISLGTINGDKNGEVSEVRSPAIEFTPIFDVAIRDGVLSFAHKDGDDTDRFEVRPNGDSLMLRLIPTPELAAELARDGIPAPAPIRLARTGR